MGKLVYWMNCSLDGFVNDANGEFDWGAPSEEVLTAINDEMEGVSTYLYGRRIYELMRVWELDPAFASGDSPGSARFARIWQQAEKIVYSTTLPAVDTARTRLERTFDPEAIRRLKAESEGDLTVDGPTLAAHALRHGLVDEISPLVSPIVLGGGLPLLPAGLRLDLTLTGTRHFDSGAVRLSYAVR